MALRLYRSILIVLSFFMLTASKCKKDRGGNPIDQLPAATQTGANTFGCLVNGQVFLPGDAALGASPLQANYQYLDTNIGGGYFLRLIATHGKGNDQIAVGIGTDSLQVHEGMTTYLDTIYIAGKAYGLYTGSGNSQRDWAYSTKMPKYTGQLLITHLDLVNQIICGTFWFSAVNNNGDSVKITDGRFDTHFTK